MSAKAAAESFVLRRRVLSENRVVHTRAVRLLGGPLRVQDCKDHGEPALRGWLRGDLRHTWARLEDSKTGQNTDRCEEAAFLAQTPCPLGWVWGVSLRAVAVPWL